MTTTPAATPGDQAPPAPTTPEEIRRHQADTGHQMGDEPTTCVRCAVSEREVLEARRQRRAWSRYMDQQVTRALRWAER